MAQPQKKTALITGASVGIGYELAKQFARGGYDLLLAARNEEKLATVAEELRGLGVQADYLVTDLARPGGPLALYAQAVNRGVPVDVLVNNAGFGAIGPFHQLDLPRQLEVIQVNVAALVDLTHRFLPEMIARRTGGVLNVASTAAFQPGPYMAIYYATKAFVLSFSEAIAEELQGTGVTVTALCPGPTESEFRTRSKNDPTAPIRRSKFIPTATAQSVARAGYQAFVCGKRIVVPGLVNKLAIQSNRLAPRRAITKLAAKINKAK
jgi:uncharacterized protein